MTRFRHIVAATDLSPASWSAVAYAGHLAKDRGAELTVVHVAHATSVAYTDFVPPIDIARIDEAIESAARDHLEKWCAKNLKHVSYRTLVRRGVVHEVLRDVAKAVRASVIVIATHGRRGLGHLVLGSVTERLLRDAPCPVLVVRPPPAAYTRPSRARTRARTRAVAA